jgi:hypothetical protein
MSFTRTSPSVTDMHGSRVADKLGVTSSNDLTLRTPIAKRDPIVWIQNGSYAEALKLLALGFFQLPTR